MTVDRLELTFTSLLKCRKVQVTMTALDTELTQTYALTVPWGTYLERVHDSRSQWRLTRANVCVVNCRTVQATMIALATEPTES